MIVPLWMLPVGKGRYTLWSSATLVLGILPKAKVMLFSPFVPDAGQMAEIRAACHDYVWRWQSRRGLPKRMATSFWFRMIWGLIALLALDTKEDLVWALYLLLWCPVMVNLVEAIWKAGNNEIINKFRDLMFYPEVEAIVSPSLQRLTEIVEERGVVTALQSLNELGLVELKEFYRRAAWSGRWQAPAPIGMGVFQNVSRM